MDGSKVHNRWQKQTKHDRHLDTKDTMTKRKGFFSEEISTYDNFVEAFYNSSRNKKRRKTVVKFESSLEENLNFLLSSYLAGSFETSQYHYFVIHEPKERIISRLPYLDHVFHWAILNIIEDYFVRSFTEYTYGGIKGRGPHGYMRAIKNALREHPGETKYFLKMDVTKFYPSVSHESVEEFLARKIKDRHLLDVINGIIESVGGDIGLPIGTKLSQFLACVVLCFFDHDLKRCFNIKDNPVLVAYYTRRYIELKIDTAETDEDFEELAKGSTCLANQFRRYLNRIDYCYRLADDMVILHSDKTFLSLVVEWVGLYLATELKLTLNHKWRIAPVDVQGIDSGGYVHFHTHVKARKRNKQALCRQVAKLRKKGLSNEEIRQMASSRIGFIQHADCINLLNKLGMETRKRLGQKIRDKKSPWPDLAADRKRKFEDILYDTRLPESERGDENEKLIELLDYKIEDSKIEKETDGTPKKCLVIRYKWQGEEWYSFTGSGVLIDQALTEFSKEDLPADTVVKVLENKFKKKFYRFT